MRRSTRRRQLEQSPRSWAVLPHGPFGPVKIHATTAGRLIGADASACSPARADDRPNLNQPVRMEPESLSMTAFFEYMHDHAATTDLSKALADAVMLRTSGARSLPFPSTREQIAS